LWYLFGVIQYHRNKNISKPTVLACFQACFMASSYLVFFFLLGFKIRFVCCRNLHSILDF
jgi:hypothetical protein